MVRYDSGCKNARLIPAETELIASGIPVAIIRLDKDRNPTHTERYNLQNVRFTSFDAERIARSLLPTVQAYYEDPVNRAEFERWFEEQKKYGKASNSPK